MTVRAARIVRPLGFRGRGTADTVRRMALQAEERLAQGEQVVVHRAVRRMARSTVLGNVRMLIHKGPFLLRMTLGAGCLDRVLPEIFFGAASVRVVAVRAENLLFRHGVVVRQREGRFDILMAPLAHLGSVPEPHLQIVPSVDIVAIRTGYIGHSMRARIPVVQVERRIGGMTLEADKGPGLRREVLYVDERLIVARGLLSRFCVSLYFLRRQAFDGKTTRTMAAFAVHERQSGFPRELRTHGREVEIATLLVMDVARLKAVVRADIVRIHPTDDHQLIFFDGQDRSRLFERRTPDCKEGAQKSEY